MQDEDFNLFKTDGSIFIPFDKNKRPVGQKDFNNILRLKPYGHYAFFKNQGLVPTMQLADSAGQIIVESGRYDGISAFNGKYAFVSAEGRIGLIDTLGREIIAPQDLHTSKIALIDSMSLDSTFFFSFSQRNYAKTNNLPLDLTTGLFDLSQGNPDIDATQRAALLNLILEKKGFNLLNKASNIKIERVKNRYTDLSSETEMEKRHNELELKQYWITDNILSFGWGRYHQQIVDFYNFKKENGRWVEKKITDILDLSSNNRLIINGLMVQKIRLLKDKFIDCSDTASFLTQLENQFLLTETGIDFSFVLYLPEGFPNYELVSLSFTWGELTPFLKK